MVSKAEQPKQAVGQPAPVIGKALVRQFADVAAQCPYDLPRLAVYHQALFGSLTDSTISLLLENGCRRNGNCIYFMRCPDCRACIPLRLRSQQFTPSRTQRRIWKKNADVNVGLAPVTMSDENLDLLDRFLCARFPGSHADAESYYSGFFVTSMTKCFEIRYRTEGRLLGVAIVDCSDQWLNAVYFYFDPNQGQRSPGTLNILYLLDFCHRHGIPFLYLGYWIEEVKGMRYKQTFRPHEILIDGCWQRIG